MKKQDVDFKKLLDETRLKRSGAADLCGVSERTIKAWVLGEFSPRPEAVKKLRQLTKAIKRIFND